MNATGKKIKRLITDRQRYTNGTISANNFCDKGVPKLYVVYQTGDHWGYVNPVLVYDYGTKQWFRNSEMAETGFMARVHPNVEIPVNNLLDGPTLRALVAARGLMNYLMQGGQS